MYLDIIFIENTLMNYVILLTTGIICKAKIKQTRILIASTLGSIYTISYYITKFSIYLSIFGKVMLSFCMIYIAFKTLTVKEFLKKMIIFYLVSFAFGGCAFTILYYLDSKNIVLINGKIIGLYSIKATIIGGIIGFIIINIAFRIVKHRLNVDDIFCNIKISINGREKRLKAMIDTGNFLKDPITNNSVIVVEKESLIDIVPAEILDNTKKIINGEYEIKNVEYLPKLRILPFSSLGKSNGILLGIKVDKVEVELNDEHIIKDNTIVGIYDKKLSNNNTYNCLLGLNYIE